MVALFPINKLDMKKLALFFLFFFWIFSLFGKDDWQSYKQTTINEMAKIHGWCTEEKAQLMMDLIKENKFQNCIEIGVFSGRSLFPVANALKYLGVGRVYGIDAWDAIEALKYLDMADPNYVWWSKIDFNLFYKQTLSLIEANDFKWCCRVIKKSAQDAANMFGDGTIDFVHFDGNHNENAMIQDVVTYFSKLKDKGYMLLNDPNWISSRQALVYLLERADVESPFTPSATFLLFRKNDQKIKRANDLINNYSTN